MAGSLWGTLGLLAGTYAGKVGLDLGSNVIASNVSSRKQYKYAARLAELQYRLQQQSLQESPTNQRLGLTKAGYNAMLPYMSGSMTNAPSVGLASATGAPVNGVGGSLGDVASAFKLKDEIANIKANTSATNATAELSREQAQTEQSKRDLMQIEQLGKEIDNQIKRKDLDIYDRRWYLEQKERINTIRKLYMDADSSRIAANANQVASNAKDFEAHNKGFSTTVKVGPFSASHTGSPNEYTKRSGKKHIEYEYIGGKRVPVTVYD